MSPERAKYGDGYFGLLGLVPLFGLLTRGDALRFAQRLPLAVILRAFGAAEVKPIADRVCLNSSFIHTGLQPGGKAERHIEKPFKRFPVHSSV
jgi:hypothetical protein